jgi:hypothetical protein
MKPSHNETVMMIKDTSTRDATDNSLRLPQMKDAILGKSGEQISVGMVGQANN